VDLGIGQEWAVIAHHDGSIERVARPAPWAADRERRRRIARQRSRRIVGSRGYRQANAKLAALDRHAVNLRKNQAHTLTTTLARRYGTVVLEDLAWIHRGSGVVAGHDPKKGPLSREDGVVHTAIGADLAELSGCHPPAPRWACCGVRR
jgi:hypothetical protein